MVETSLAQIVTVVSHVHCPAGVDFVTRERLSWADPRWWVVEDVALTRETPALAIPAPTAKPPVGPPTGLPRPQSESKLPCPSRDASARPQTLRLARTSVNESGAFRRASSGKCGVGGSSTASARAMKEKIDPVPPGLVERCVMVWKEAEGGFGFCVTGEHPVFVQKVQEDGAAARAGLRQGDRILKVNGRPVTKANHLAVCEMIASAEYVALSLLGKPPAQGPPTRSASARPLSHPSITAPTPLDEEKQAEWRKRRVEILNQMLDEERRHLEGLRRELGRVGRREASSPRSEAAARLRDRIEAAGGRIASLDDQLASVHPPPPPSKDPKPTAPATTNDSAPQDSADKGTTLGMSSEAVAEAGLTVVAAGDVDVVPMESEDEDEEALGDLDVSSPFSNLPDLKARVGHLAVFLNYLLANSDPASLLFYLVSDLFDAAAPQASLKELRKWIYEIHSTFLVPTAPAPVPRIGRDVVAEIDEALAPDGGSEDAALLRRVFVRARQKALDDVRERLMEFRGKLRLGLGNVFGAERLEEAGEERSKELKVADAVLMPHLERLFDGVADYERLGSRAAAVAAALATVAKSMGVRPACGLHDKLLDRCPVFVAKASGLRNKLRISASKKSLSLKGHQLSWSAVTSVVWCYECREMVWGVGAAAYSCAHCDVVVHKACLGSLHDHCYPASQKKTRARPLPHHQPISEESEPAMSFESGGPKYGSLKSAVRKLRLITFTSAAVRDREVSLSRSPGRNPRGSRRRWLEEPGPSLRPAASDSRLASPTSPCFLGGLSPPAPDFADGLERGRSPNSWAGEKPTHLDVSYRHHPHPSAIHKISRCSGGVDDGSEERDVVAASLAGSPRGKAVGPVAGVGDWSGKSSDSGYEGDGDPLLLAQRSGPIHRSQSMRTRDENVRASKRLGLDPASTRRAKSDVDGDDKAIALAMAGRPGGGDSSSSSVQADSLPASDLEDSDVEAAPDVAPLDSVVSPDALPFLKPKEKKRQEVLNELFHTERTHVGKLKILHRHFQNPLLVNQILRPETVKLLFGNIEEMLELHEGLNRALKEERRVAGLEKGLIGGVGELMCAHLAGEAGLRFAAAAAAFCQHQQFGLAELRTRQKKDSKLGAFLAEAEAHPVCRRLQLKDLIPAEMQRLTKYPLLLETIAKYTPEGSDELAAVNRALLAAKTILHTVNVAKRESENVRRLGEIAERLDTGPFDKENHPVSKAFKGLDLRRHALVHDGPLAWRLGKNKVVELQVVLVESLLVLATRGSSSASSEGRLVLRYYDMAALPDGKWCPVLSLHNLMAKSVATDKKAFFLVSTSSHTGPQIYELVASSLQEKKTWLAAIQEQVEACRSAGREAAEAAEAGAKAPLATLDAAETASLASTVSASTSSGRDVEKISMTSHARLINPADVEVAQPTVLQHARPILTPLERMRRQDAALAAAMKEKTAAVAEAGGMSAEEVLALAQGLADGVRGPRDSKELVMSAIVQSNRLLEAINDGMRLNEALSSEDAPVLVGPEPGPSVPCLRLATIAAPLIKHLTNIMQSMQSQEEELRRVRLELAHYKSLQERGCQATSAGTDSDLGSSPSSTSSGAGEGPAPSRSLAPGVPVASASSEETLTGTPLVKTPDSLPLQSAPLHHGSASLPAPQASAELRSPAARPASASPTPAKAAEGAAAKGPDSPRLAAAGEEAEKRRLTEKRKAKRERQAAHLTPDPVPDDSKKPPTLPDAPEQH